MGTLILAVILALLVLAQAALILALLVQARSLKKDLDQTTKAQAFVQLRLNRARLFLEQIRDMGPKECDPHTPCRFCGQAEGHWGNPTHKNCPAIFAYHAIRDIS